VTQARHVASNISTTLNRTKRHKTLEAAILLSGAHGNGELTRRGQAREVPPMVNGAELRGCKINYSDSSKGFGIFSSNEVSDGVLLVVPLDLAITPMRVLQDPLLGPECRAMFEEGDVDDRFLMILFLTVERVRKNSSWKPYLDMLPTTFGNPLWFTDDELLELKGTTLYRATELQKKSLRSLYDGKLKTLVEKLLTLDGDLERFPLVEGVDIQVNGVTFTSKQKETVWVEGLVPGIDFCNHGNHKISYWFHSIPLLFFPFNWKAVQPLQIQGEISISYGNKGNEELLYLYGFVLDGNPDDYLMVHYPMEAIQSVPFSDPKSQLLEAQKAEMRCLLPRSLLDYGFFPPDISNKEGDDKCKLDHGCSYSWSGQRKMPTYLHRLVFPENFLTALRTIAMQEDELFQVSSLLEEIWRGRQPSDSEVRAAVWEACGDSGALQLLVDLLNVRLTDLLESSGTEDSDTSLLKNAHIVESANQHTDENSLSQETNGSGSTQQYKLMSRNVWASIVYRRGQKQLTRLFLKEAEHALELALSEGN
ncbi:SET domain-containing protein, partial [Prunus dulcis]